MSKDYVEELMNILDRDEDDGKFTEEESEFIIVEDDYDENSYEDADDFVVIEDNNDSSNEAKEDDIWFNSFDDSMEEVKVIDTEYVPENYYEEDLFDEKYLEKESDNGISIFDLSNDDFDFNFDFDKEDEKDNKDSLLVENSIDDRISKNIAKDIINSDVDMTIEEDVNDNWIADDMFGNDISKMLIEEEHPENAEFSNGSFADWVK